MWNYAHVQDYLAICRRAAELTSQGRRVRLSWAGEALDAEGWRRSFRRALHSRINSKGGLYDTGRKRSPEYQTGLVRDARRVQDRLRGRVRFYGFETPELRGRLGHLVSSHDD
jgi:hypothetical protein